MKFVWKVRNKIERVVYVREKNKGTWTKFSLIPLKLSSLRINQYKTPRYVFVDIVAIQENDRCGLPIEQWTRGMNVNWLVIDLCFVSLLWIFLRRVTEVTTHDGFLTANNVFTTRYHVKFVSKNKVKCIKVDTLRVQCREERRNKGMGKKRLSKSIN